MAISQASTEAQTAGEVVDAAQADRWTDSCSGPRRRRRASAGSTSGRSTRSSGRWSSPASSAIELAQLAMEETQFGVLEDKVVKNYIATEFLYDYLKDKPSVGVIEEEPKHGIQRVAEPIGVVLALLPITNPTSTALFKSIVAAKTRSDDHLPPLGTAAAAPRGRSRSSRRPASPPGCRPTLQVIPTRPSTSQYLFHDGIDLIWTTGGPKAVAAANAAGKPSLSVGAGNPSTCTGRRHRDGGRRHADLEDLRRLRDLPGGADLRRRRGDLRRPGRRVRAPRRAAPGARPGRCARRSRLRAGRAGRRSRARPVLRQPRGDGRLRGGGRGQGPARSAALRSRRARRAPPDRRS